MTFERRPLAGPDTLGQRLHALREERRVSLEDLSEELRVNKKYLEALENGQYQDLPGQVYARNFVRLYVGWAGLDERAALQRFDQEYSIVQAARPQRRPLLVQRANTEWPWWRRHTRLIFAIGAVAIAMGYFGWQVYHLYAPPELRVVRPAGDVSTSASTIKIQGQTASGAQVMINGGEVSLNRDGSFSVTIDLQPGLNTLRITSQTQRSRPRVVTIQVLREVKPSTSGA